jgi:hypothetical protein
MRRIAASARSPGDAGRGAGTRISPAGSQDNRVLAR